MISSPRKYPRTSLTLPSVIDEGVQRRACFPIRKSGITYERKNRTSRTNRLIIIIINTPIKQKETGHINTSYSTARDSWHERGYKFSSVDDRLEPCLNHIGFLVTPRLRKRFPRVRATNALLPVILFYIEGIASCREQHGCPRDCRAIVSPLHGSSAKRPQFSFSSRSLSFSPPFCLFSLSLSFSRSLLLSFFPYVFSRLGPPPILRTGAGGRAAVLKIDDSPRSYVSGVQKRRA